MKKILIVCVFVGFLTAFLAIRNYSINTASQFQSSETNEKGIDCDSLYLILNQKSHSKDSIINLIIANNNNSLSQGNLDLLKALKTEKSYQFKFEEPLSAIFNTNGNSPFVFSDYEDVRKGESYEQVYLESPVIAAIDTLPNSPENWNKKIDFTPLLQKTTNSKAINIIGEKATSTAQISFFGKQNAECEPYLFYNFEYSNEKELDSPLIASPFKIQVEYGSWSKVNVINYDFYSPISECVDCPISYATSKSFAKLKGTENLFFMFNGIAPYTNDEHTPSRSLVYLSEKNELITLWSDSIDMFGCGCL